MELDHRIEAVLFYKAQPMRKSKIASILNTSTEEIDTALSVLQGRLKQGATRIVVTAEEVVLVTAPEHDELIESLSTDESRRDIGRAGAETLAVIMYRGPVNRAEVERIRGVNSGHTLRMLLIRGLIEKQQIEKQVKYAVTTDLLTHLGVGNITELPEFTEIRNTVAAFEQDQKAQEE